MESSFKNIEEWPIEKLIPYARNARTHSDEQVGQIAASINEWGFTNPIIVDDDGNVIAGHGRLLAARKLGRTHVPVRIVSDWPEAKKKAYILADNKLALNAGWDDELLRLEIEELKELDFDIDLIGFENNEILSISFDNDAFAEMPALSEGDKPEFQRICYVLHDQQADVVKNAIEKARLNPLCNTGINANSNANALSIICDEWLKGKNGKS